MKITIYELLGLIKDGKAPKKIKYGLTTYTYAYKGGIGEAYDYIDNKNNYLFKRLVEYAYLTNMLTQEVEIIEEDKDIEELNIPCNFKCTKNGMTNSDREQLDFNFKNIENKINELIKEVNKLKGKYE